MAENQRSLRPRKIAMRRTQSIAGFCEYPTDPGPLAFTDLDGNEAVSFEKGMGVSSDRPVGIETISSSVQGAARIMKPHFRLEPFDLVGSYIGRV